MDRIDLETLHIVYEPDLPHYANHALTELTDYLERYANAWTVRTYHLPEVTDPALLVGAKAREVLGEERLRRLGLAPELGDEGYVLVADTSQSPPLLIAVGNTPAGTRHALLALLRRIDPTTRPASVRLPLKEVTSPARSLRGMYAHQHWAYRHPYALRSWSVEEWKRYIDILALLHLNHHMIWTMAGIVPAPFEPADENFLHRYPPLIEHARTNHNMEVWAGECANNIGKPHPQPRMQDRYYFDAEILLNPADSEDRKRLEQHREAFYTLVNNADGYWTLDSDPGGWKGSPSREFVDIVEMNRRLIDDFTVQGERAKFIYWMWLGWGTGEREDNWRETLREIKNRFDDLPWLTVAWPGHMEIAESLGWPGDRIVYYPYGAIEPEPSQPFTDVIPDRLRECLRTGTAHPAWPGLLGNAQSPLVQLPNIHFFAEAAWDTHNIERSREESLKELARLVFPAKESELAEAWSALADKNIDRARSITRELSRLLRNEDFGTPGPLGAKIFPAPDRIAEDLYYQLALHTAAEEFKQAAAEKDWADENLMRPLRNYVRRSISWRQRTGFKHHQGDPVTSEGVKRAVDARWADGERIVQQVSEEIGEAIESMYDAREREFYMEWFGKNWYNK